MAKRGGVDDIVSRLCGGIGRSRRVGGWFGALSSEQQAVCLKVRAEVLAKNLAANGVASNLSDYLREQTGGSPSIPTLAKWLLDAQKEKPTGG